MDNVPAGSSYNEYWNNVGQPSSPILGDIYRINAPDVRSVEGDANVFYRLKAQDSHYAFLVKEVLPVALEDLAVTNERAIMMADIDPYMKTFVSNSIMNGITDAQWNEHLRNAERLRIPAYIKSWQDLYNRVNKK